MHLFRVILLALISFQLSSCALNPRVLKFRKNDNGGSNQAALFRTDGASAVYSTKVDFYKFHFSGLVAIKRNTRSNYDVALVSEMGLTLMKMRYVNGVYQDVVVLEELNRPMIIKLIQQDLAMLMIDEADYKQQALYQRSNNAEVLKLKKRGEVPYYIYTSHNSINRIDKANALGKKVSVRVVSYDGTIPNEILLKHYGLKNATLNFKKLKQESKEDEYGIEE